MIELVSGIVGMFLILLAFLMNQFHRWKTDSLIYDLVNVIGSLLLMVYAIFLNSYPFIILNLIWLLFSLRDVFLDIKSHSHPGRKKAKRRHLD